MLPRHFKEWNEQLQRTFTGVKEHHKKLEETAGTNNDTQRKDLQNTLTWSYFEVPRLYNELTVKHVGLVSKSMVWQKDNDMHALLLTFTYMVYVESQLQSSQMY